MSEKDQYGECERGAREMGNVVALVPRKRGEPAEPFFTDAERAEIRQMLAEFNLVKQSCPMARRLLSPD